MNIGPLQNRTNRLKSGAGFGPRRMQGFTLLEVMVACFVFFMVAFAVLELVTRSLVMAKSLQRNTVTPGMVAAELSITNRLEEGSYSGDFGDIHPDYSWEYFVEEAESNGLFRVDFIIIPKKAGEEPTKMSTLMYKPGSPAGSRFGRLQ
jgi:Prokaryotic N-terminal methylation motif